MKRRKVIVVLLMCALINQILVGVGHVLDKDFEGDSLSPWKEESAGGNRWEIEDFRHPFETNNAAPRKNDGSKYLRLRRASDGLFGVAQLRSPVFIAHPGDRISFSYWIRSRFNNFNSLQVFWSPSSGGPEQLLIDLFSVSNPHNSEWRLINEVIHVSSPTQGTVVVYGFCGLEDLDAIAIDDISIIQSDITTVSGPPCTSEETTTPTRHLNSGNNSWTTDQPWFTQTSSIVTESSTTEESTVSSDGNMETGSITDTSLSVAETSPSIAPDSTAVTDSSPSITWSRTVAETGGSEATTQNLPTTMTVVTFTITSSDTTLTTESSSDNCSSIKSTVTPLTERTTSTETTTSSNHEVETSTFTTETSVTTTDSTETSSSLPSSASPSSTTPKVVTCEEVAGQFNCPANDGFYAFAPCSAAFIQCSNGFPYCIPCPGGTVFNGILCEWPANVPECNSVMQST